MQFVQYLCTLPSDDTYGYIQALPLANVTVYQSNDDGTNGPLAQLYDAEEHPITNPVVADVNGFAGFAAADGLYNIQVTDAGNLRNAPLAVKVQFFDQQGFNAIAGVVSQAVIGQNTSTDQHFAQYNGTTGAQIKDTGLSFDTDGTLGANSDSRIPSQKAVKTAIAAAQQVVLASDTTYYVRTDGNDSNAGIANTSGGAWATIQHAVDTVGTLDLNGHTVTIQVGDGTYAAGVSRNTGFNRNGTVILQGNVSTPSNCVISTSTSCLIFTNCVVTILGFKLVSATGSGISAARSLITINGAMEYGACAGNQLAAFESATILVSANYVISGNAAAHFGVINAAILFKTALTVTIAGTPFFSAAFANLTNLAVLSLFTPNTVFSGSATGKRFIIADLSVVNAGSNAISGPSLNAVFPGDASGSYAQRQDGLRSFRNLIYNPDGRVQEGPSGGVGDTVYGLHNRWYALTQTSTITPGTILDVSDGVTHLIELTNTSGSFQRMGYAQIIEGKNCKWLRGSDVTLSGVCQRNQTGGFAVAIVEWTGTEDAVTTRDIVNDWTNASYTTGAFFVSSNILVDGVMSTNPGAGVLSNFNLQATLGETFNNIIVFIWARNGVTVNTGTLDFRMQLESGITATLFERRPYEAEENLCHRYYESFTVQSENGSRNIPLLKKRVTPSITVGVGSAGSITKNGFELTHSAAAACTVIASAEL